MAKGCKVSDFNLFHVTAKRNVESIMREGLVPFISDYTKRCWVSERLYEDYGFTDDDEGAECNEDEGCDISYDDAKAIVEKEANEALRKVVFASKNLEKAIGMVSDDPNHGDVAVIGIKKGCEDNFHKQKVGDVDDYVSYRAIPPGCLHVIDEAEWRR